MCDKLDAALAVAGIDVVWTDGDLLIVPNDNDALIRARHPEFAHDYDAFLTLHYDADVYAGRGGWFWDRAQGDPQAVASDRLGGIIQRRYSALIGQTGLGPDFHPERRNANTFNYYGFRQTTAATPGVLVEFGVGYGADRDWLIQHQSDIAALIKSALIEFGGVPVSAPTTPLPAPAPAPAPQPAPPAPPTAGRPVLGAATFRYRRLLAKLDADNPDAPLEIAGLYERLGHDAGVSADVALAQAIHETGSFRFTGDAKPEWHNPCGLGVGAQPIPGRANSSDCKFATWEEGIRAHFGHVLAYFMVVGTAHVPGFCDKDPRHVEHRGLPNSVTELGGPGRWAPSPDYGARLAALLA